MGCSGRWWEALVCWCSAEAEEKRLSQWGQRWVYAGGIFVVVFGGTVVCVS